MLSQEQKEKVVIIIPSLSPNKELIKVIEDLKEAGFAKILIINDGSEACSDIYFEHAQKAGCYICTHETNLGKGRALKTAFAYIEENIPDCIGAVTVDGDGQHQIDDIINCAEAMVEHPQALVLGCRNFHSKAVPWRSKFGNLLTCKVFYIFVGVSISDTQTGLRGIPRSLLGMSLETEGERFEYETNILLQTKERKVPIFEVSISTIYLAENKSSHFNTLKDSFRIYKLFVKFILASIASFVIDIALFTLLSTLLYMLPPARRIPAATIGARLVSSLCNYYINRKKVFRTKEGIKRSVARYYFLAAIQMAVSALVVTLLHLVIPIYPTILKVIVDSILFFLSFCIQREWVFKE